MRTLLATLGLLVSLPLLAGEAELNAAVVALQSPESVLIDVRTAEEFAAGALPGAEQIEHEQIASRISALVPGQGHPHRAVLPQRPTLIAGPGRTARTGLHASRQCRRL